jgi:hypothetical protein
VTDDELKKLVAGLAIAQDRTDVELDKLIAAQVENKAEKSAAHARKEAAHVRMEAAHARREEALEKLIAAQAKTDAQLAKTDAKIDKLAKMYGGVGNNQGDVAEAFFFNSITKDNHLGSIRFDDATKNMDKKRGNIQEEYDIFLTNGEAIAVIEVKYKAHLGDVDKLDRKVNNFKKLFPIYKEYKLYGAMASFHFNSEIKDKLLDRGYFVVERQGELIHTENSDYLRVV